MELVCTPKSPKVQHLRKHGSMDSMCGIDYFLLIRVRQGQKGDGLPLCRKCEHLDGYESAKMIENTAHVLAKA